VSEEATEDDNTKPWSGRRLAREIAIQLLYECDLNPERMTDNPTEYIQRHLTAQPAGLSEFALELVLGVRSHRDDLDEVILGCAENWTIARMAPTDRNVIRLATFELTQTSTPGQVVIDEAVELAKRFGTKDSPSFVNGVLDKVLQGRS
jgi:transcription antitermination protein NusB